MTADLDPLDALAADYALGTLDGRERRRAEALIARDPSFAERVETWTARLAPLAELIDPVEPPAGVWRNIEAQIGRDDMTPEARALRSPLLERLTFWRWCTLGAGAVAAGLALYIVAAPLLPGLGPNDRFVAVLNQDPTSPAWLVTVDLAAQRLTIQPLAELPKRDKAYELWLVAGGDTPPRSLGLLQPEQPTTLPVAAVLRPDVPRAAALAVSLEPAGGSPTGLPTGPVVYQGALLPLRD